MLSRSTERAAKGHLKRLILRISSIRIVSKKKLEDRKLQEACNKEALLQDEIRSRMVSCGMDEASNIHGAPAETINPRVSINIIRVGSSRSFEDPGFEFTEEDIDPRFIMNPIGIGSYRSFEKPHSKPTEDTELVPSTSIVTGFDRYSVVCDNAKTQDHLSTSEPQKPVCVRSQPPGRVRERPC